MSDAFLMNEPGMLDSSLDPVGSMGPSDVSSSYALALAAVLSAGLQSNPPDFPEPLQLSEGSSSGASPKLQESSERRKKKPYKELTLEEKVQLIRLAEENAGMSQAAIAERYAIAKSNVCRILQRKREYLRAFESAGFAGSRKRKLKAADMRTNLQPEQQRKDSGSDTLRGHMYSQHGVARMFMCRCCNWAFPDKNALQLHIQVKDDAQASGSSSTQSASSNRSGNDGRGVEVEGPPPLPLTAPLPPFPSMIPGLLPPSVPNIPVNRIPIIPTSLDTTLDLGSSAFSPLRPIPINNNTLPSHFGIGLNGQGVSLAVPSLPLFSSSPIARSPEEMMNRLRERVMLNALLGSQPTLPSTPSWLNNSIFALHQQVNKTPIQLQFDAEDRIDDIINVENDGNPGVDENAQPSGSKSEGLIKKCEQADNSRSTMESSTSLIHPSTHDSPSQNTTPCPINVFKKEPNTPSAFHPMLKIEPRSERNGEEGPIHISPSDSHTSGSTPGGSCNGTANCFECSVMRSRTANCEQRVRFLEETRDHLQAELLRAQTCILNSETTGQVLASLRAENQRLKHTTQQARRQITNYLICGAVSHETRTILESLNRIF